MCGAALVVKVDHLLFSELERGRDGHKLAGAFCPPNGRRPDERTPSRVVLLEGLHTEHELVSLGPYGSGTSHPPSLDLRQLLFIDYRFGQLSSSQGWCRQVWCRQGWCCHFLCRHGFGVGLGDVGVCVCVAVPASYHIRNTP